VPPPGPAAPYAAWRPLGELWEAGRALW
jgi:hypothetical protein